MEKITLKLWSPTQAAKDLPGVWAWIKVAADLYPFRFIAIKAKAKRDGGGWDVEEF